MSACADLLSCVVTTAKPQVNDVPVSGPLQQLSNAFDILAQTDSVTVRTTITHRIFELNSFHPTTNPFIALVH